MSDKVTSKTDVAPDPETDEESSPYFRIVLWSAQAVSIAFLFLAIVSSPLTLQAIGGFTGGSSVKIWSLVSAICGLSIALEYGGKESVLRRARGDVWSVFVLFLAFLVCLNYFLHVAYTWSPQGLMYGHDSPQYYMQLHSFVFDRDADFTNEYKLLPRITDNMAEWRPKDIGTDYNVAPVGTAILWLPFYLAAFPCMYLLKAAGVPAVIDGVSSPFAMAAGFGSNAMVFLGMLCIFFALRRWFSYRSALATTLMIYGATNLLWYISGQVWMSHAASFFIAAAVLYVWARTREKRSLAGWLVLGGLIGMAMLVRPSHAALAVLPLADAVVAIFRRDRIAQNLAGLSLSGGAMTIVFSAQLMTWFVRSGVGTPPGNPILWTHPSVIHVLFSAHNGLISWHPVVALGFLGVPLLWSRSRLLCISTGLILILHVYMNAGISDWTGGASFGMRRFVGTLPFLAPGMAACGSWMVGAIRRRPLILASIGILLASVYNFALTVSHKELLFRADAPIPFTHAWSMAGLLVQDTIGNPSSFPANYIFAQRTGLSPMQYDVLSSNRALGRPIEATGLMLDYYLGDGWEFQVRHRLEETSYATARSSVCHIMLPLRDMGHYRVELQIAGPRGLSKPQVMTVYLNDEKLGTTPLKADSWNRVGFDVGRPKTILGLNDLRLEFEQSETTPYVYNPPNEKSVLGFSDEVKARYQAPEEYWAVLRKLSLNRKGPPAKKNAVRTAPPPRANAPEQPAVEETTVDVRE